MRFGIIGLGRMGGGIALHAIEKGHEVVGYSEAVGPELQSAGVEVVESFEALASKIPAPRTVFVYVPHGVATDEVLDSVSEVFASGDIIVDGGNSNWPDGARRAGSLAAKKIRFLDVGTSGGVSGARDGACFMVGGDHEAFEVVRPLLEDLAVDPRGVIFVGPPGSGHFVKLIHNAIEFGMVQAIAEGVELLMRSDYTLDLPALFDNWMHGSVIRSWLIELMGNALRQHGDFSKLSTYVEDTGEVKWVTNWATDRDIPIPVIATSQTALIQYRDVDWPQAKAHALLRNQYGGHPMHKADEHIGRR